MDAGFSCGTVLNPETRTELEKTYGLLHFPVIVITVTLAMHTAETTQTQKTKTRKWIWLLFQQTSSQKLLRRSKTSERRNTMKLRITNFTTLLLIAVILLDGCSGCGQKTALKGIEPQEDYNNQSKYGPVAANTREPVELPPFPEPSFERLIEQFKADVAANRGNPEMLKRKKEAIADPDLLSEPYFQVPVLASPDLELKAANYYDDKIKILPHDQKGEPYLMRPHNGPEIEFTGKIYYTTKEQEERQRAIPRTLPSDERNRQWYEIEFEGINTFTAAKYLSQQGARIAQSIGLEYAERAMREHPDSVEAMFIWTQCLPSEQRIAAYRQLLSKFPNAAFAHENIAYYYYYYEDDPAIALAHIRKACQLDSRIAKKNTLLALCYKKLGEWEKSVAAYQGLSHISFRDKPFLRGAQHEIEKQYDEQFTRLTKIAAPYRAHLSKIINEHAGSIELLNQENIDELLQLNPDLTPTQVILLKGLAGSITWQEAIKKIDAIQHKTRIPEEDKQ